MKISFHYVLYGLFSVIFFGIGALGFIARQNGSAFLKTSEQIEITDKILGETAVIDALDDEIARVREDLEEAANDGEK